MFLFRSRVVVSKWIRNFCIVGRQCVEGAGSGGGVSNDGKRMVAGKGSTSQPADSGQEAF